MEELTVTRHDRSQQVLSWECPSKNLKLAGNEVHVWRALYADLYHQLDDVVQLLPRDECAEADKYHMEKDRQRYILRHAVLRQIMACYLHRNPAQLEFQKNDHGKPFLKTAGGGNSVFFSMTHSMGLALCAFSRDLEIGVDVEHIHPFPDMNNIVHRFFSFPERSEFALLPTEKRLRAFFRGWTCKEALLKAMGRGLSDGLDGFCVTMDPDKETGIRNMDSQSIEAKDWILEIAEPFPDHISAVAVKSRDKQYEVKYLKWT